MKITYAVSVVSVSVASATVGDLSNAGYSLVSMLCAVAAALLTIVEADGGPVVLQETENGQWELSPNVLRRRL